MESSLPILPFAGSDCGHITCVQIVVGKYRQKFTAIGSLTVWYVIVPTISRTVCNDNSGHFRKPKSGDVFIHLMTNKLSASLYIWEFTALFLGCAIPHIELNI